MTIIYKIEGPLNIPDKCKNYVGLTTNTLDERWRKHKSDFKQFPLKKNDRYFCKALCESVEEYNVKNFKISLLENCDKEISDEKEVYWIKELNSIYPNGYNYQSGGKSGFKHNKETIDILSTDDLNPEKITKIVDVNKKYVDSLNLPNFMYYYTLKNTKGNIYRHGYRVVNPDTNEKRTIMVSIKDNLTKEMLEKAKEYLKMFQNYYSNKPNSSINISSTKRNDLSQNLPLYINYFKRKTRHGYRVRHYPSGKEKLLLFISIKNLQMKC